MQVFAQCASIFCVLTASRGVFCVERNGGFLRAACNNKRLVADTDPYCQRKFITDTLKYQPIGTDIGAIRIPRQYGYRCNTDIATVCVSLSRRALCGIVVRNSCTERIINSTRYLLRNVVALLPAIRYGTLWRCYPLTATR